MDMLNDRFLSEVPTDELTPDYENRDPLRDIRPGAPRMHSRFPVVPTLGQGALAVQNLQPIDIGEDPLEGMNERQQAFFRSTMTDILGEDILKK
jgi:hypothetical protein